ncbi:MAG TPA: acyltransferase [Ktedonobacteraceae bacterium]|nr:acyltransferase [Ktedonobacteraceae bacterium]
MAQSIQHGYLWLQNTSHSIHQWLSLVLEGGRQRSIIAPLDGVRALACLSVVAYHLSLVTTHDLPLWDPTQISPLISSIALAGDTGVTLFFILSGFLLFLPYAKALLFDAEWPSLRHFYLRRALRILPAYYVSLLLMVLIYNPEYLHPDHWTRLSLFLTLFMDSFDGTYRQINGPFWSLAVEWQFYLLLPFLALALRSIVRRGPFARRISLLVGGLCLVVAWGVGTRYAGLYLTDNPTATFLVPRPVLNHVMIFVYGTLSRSGLHGKFLEDFGVGMLLSTCFVVSRSIPQEYGFNRLLHRLYPWLWTCGILWLLVMALWKFNHGIPHTVPFFDQFTDIYNTVSEICFSIGYGLCIAAILFGASWLKRPFTWSPLRWLGILSYGLYMWHLKLLEFFTDHVTTYLQTWAPPLLYSLYWLWALAFIVPCMFLLFVLVEKPWIGLGNRLLARKKPQ